MAGIPRSLIQKLRKTFDQCGPFGSNDELYRAFSDDRISPWRGRAPEGANRSARINALIDLLYGQSNTSGQNALALFLRVAGDAYEPTIACHQALNELATTVEHETNSAPTSPGSRKPQEDEVPQRGGNDASAFPSAVPRRPHPIPNETQGEGQAQGTFPQKTTKETYVDFDLHIAPDGHVTASSPEGQETATISLTLPNDVQVSLNLIDHRTANAALLKQVGQKFYDWLFPSEIHAHFRQTEAVARSQGANLRIRLRIEAEAIASLPLEFLYRRKFDYFFATNPKTVLSRYLNLPLPPGYIRRREGPLHMLAIIANPTDQTPLPPEDWERILKEALAKPLQNGQMTVKTVQRATRKEIRDALLERKPDIVQFVGHGTYQDGRGKLALVDDTTDETWWVDDERFAALFMGHNDYLGFISLATCASARSDDPQGFLGIAPKLVQRGAPAVVAMQYEVLIKTAKIFLDEVYTAIAARKPVDWAVQCARNAIALESGFDNREFATPVLYMRARDGVVF